MHNEKYQNDYLCKGVTKIKTGKNSVIYNFYLFSYEMGSDWF